MSSKQHNLGQESSFTKLPAEVTIGHDSYFLVKNEDGYRLLSSICPHAGGRVMDYGSEFACPLHFWTFDKASGKCTNIPGEQLDSFPVNVQDGDLVAEIS
jgi:nitrite reductase/ring-hydroxylating ferredoxin subunit